MSRSVTPRATHHARWRLIATVVVLLAVALVLWRVSPLSEWASPERLREAFASVRDSGWAPAIVIGVYILAGAIEFPIVLLIAATATLFPPAAAFALSLAGSLASSLVFYAAGAKLGQRTMRDALGQAIDRVQRALADRGVLAIVILRSIPFAPFSVVNLAAGSLGIPLRPYLVGTALGLLPGIIVLTGFGDRLRAVWQAPTPANVTVLAVLLAVWIGIVYLGQRLASRMARRRKLAGGTSGLTASSSGAPGSADGTRVPK